MRKKGFFLDFDGTLVDSLGIMEAVFHEFLATVGVHVATSDFHKFNGPPLKTIIQELKSLHNLKASLSELEMKYLNLINARIVSAVPSKGAIRFIEEIGKTEYSLSIVTSNFESVVESWLKTQGISQFFDSIVGVESVQVGKPHPLPYLTALQRTGCSAAHSYAVEDTEFGLTSAKQAGLHCFYFSKSTKADTFYEVQAIYSFEQLIPLFSKNV